MLKILVLQALDLPLHLLEALLCSGIFQHLELFPLPVLPSLLLLLLLDLGNPKSHLLLHFPLKPLQPRDLAQPGFLDSPLPWQQALWELQGPQPSETAVLWLALVVQAHILTLLFPSHSVALMMDIAAHPPLSPSQMAARQQVMNYSHPSTN